MNTPTPSPAPGVRLSGTTQLYPVVGSPVAQVQAPLLYNPWFAKNGVDAAVVALEIHPEDYAVALPALLRMANVRGAMVTIPHKVATVALLDDCSTAVRIAGACNAVRRQADGRLYGDLFDGAGFLRATQAHGFAPRGAACLVVGCGGAGAAIAAALAQAGVARLGLSDTRSGQAHALAQRLHAHFVAPRFEVCPADPQGFDLVVNATPLGMAEDDPLPLAVERLSPTTLVAEIVMKRPITALVAAARARGCRTQLGREMLDAQLPLYLDFFGLLP